MAAAPGLTYLDLSSNSLSGPLGGALCTLADAGLEAAYLGQNTLNGSLPACLLSNSAQLVQYSCHHIILCDLVLPALDPLCCSCLSLY